VILVDTVRTERKCPEGRFARDPAQGMREEKPTGRLWVTEVSGASYLMLMSRRDHFFGGFPGRVSGTLVTFEVEAKEAGAEEIAQS
jgi:hypothetical protein